MPTLSPENFDQCLLAIHGYWVCRDGQAVPKKQLQKADLRHTRLSKWSQFWHASNKGKRSVTITESGIHKTRCDMFKKVGFEPKLVDLVLHGIIKRSNQSETIMNLIQESNHSTCFPNICFHQKPCGIQSQKSWFFPSPNQKNVASCRFV